MSKPRTSADAAKSFLNLIQKAVDRDTNALDIPDVSGGWLGI
ncbi:MAG: hypothetical protein ABSC71_03150 [Candidatus Acidiferrales bacterium]